MRLPKRPLVYATVPAWVIARTTELRRRADVQDRDAALLLDAPDCAHFAASFADRLRADADAIDAEWFPA